MAMSTNPTIIASPRHVLDVAQHLRDTDENVQQDGHQFRETGKRAVSSAVVIHWHGYSYLPAGSKYNTDFFRLSKTNRPCIQLDQSQPKH